MSLFSIVASDEFISVVLGKYEYENIAHNLEERITFREIPPKQAFCIFSGDTGNGENTWKLVEQLVAKGASLKEIAVGIHENWQKQACLSECLQAVIGGISATEEIQYHIITTNQKVQSYYPKQSESLYYANDLSHRLNPMEKLAKELMMTGISSSNQAQHAQYKLLAKVAGTMPGFFSLSRVMERVH